VVSKLGAFFTQESQFGDLDCLGTIDDGKTYDDLIGSAAPIDVGGNRPLFVLDLKTLIEVKRRAGRPKDIAALPVLQATLEERRRERIL